MFRFMTPVLLALVDMQLIGVSVSPWGFMFFLVVAHVTTFGTLYCLFNVEFFCNVDLCQLSTIILPCNYHAHHHLITSLHHRFITSCFFLLFFIVVLSIAHLGFIVAFRSLSLLRSFRSLRFLPSLRSLRRCVCYVCCAY